MVQSDVRLPQAHLSLSASGCELTVSGSMKAGGEASFRDTSVCLIYDSAEMEFFANESPVHCLQNAGSRVKDN